ncbi:hypothetical protein HK100_005634, partial [Physocladia obscura]
MKDIPADSKLTEGARQFTMYIQPIILYLSNHFEGGDVATFVNHHGKLVQSKFAKEKYTGDKNSPC